MPVCPTAFNAKDLNSMKRLASGTRNLAHPTIIVCVSRITREVLIPPCKASYRVHCPHLEGS